MRLKDKVAIVTGGGRGIGKAIALALAQEGANVAVVSRTLPEIDATASEVKALKRQALPIKADVSSWEDATRIARLTIQEFGRIDILVNNAGTQGPIGLLVENDVTRWLETIHVNLIGTFHCSRAVLPSMMERCQGKIINLSGGGATSPRPYLSAYAASKAAIVRLTETLAEEVKKFNIQVNAIAPGAVNTKMLNEVLAAGEAAGGKALAEAKHQKETGGTPPEKAAALAVFLASNESNGLTGRLISAVWDNWQEMGGQIEKIMTSNLYTLRRLVE
jgi:NAD(P)-dependent dehydrogenase (short-subunit alcohol dehydrogenase family)